MTLHITNILCLAPGLYFLAYYLGLLSGASAVLLGADVSRKSCSLPYLPLAPVDDWPNLSKKAFT